MRECGVCCLYRRDLFGRGWGLSDDACNATHTRSAFPRIDDYGSIKQIAALKFFLGIEAN
jgi:hypothetical protein